MRAPRARLVLALALGLAVGCGPPLPTTSSSSSGSSSSRVPASGGGTGGSGGTGGGAVPGGTAPVALVATDDPFPFPFLNDASVRIQRVELRASGGAYTVLEDWGATPGFFELLSLRNGKTTNVAAKTLPQGAYDSLRVTFASGSVRSSTGLAFTAVSPSVLETPVALSLASGGAQVLLDLDLAASFTIQPAAFLGSRPISDGSQIAGIAFSPVGRAAVVGQGGSVAGQVADPTGGSVGGVLVQALVSGSPVASTSTDASGSFALVELPPGSYTLAASAWGSGETGITGPVDVAPGATRTATISLGTAPAPVPSPSPPSGPAPSPSPSVPPPSFGGGN